MGGDATQLQDHVVLVDDVGYPVGTAPRGTVHSAATPLHLGFSCYLFRADGQMLLTRRTLSKRTWPGVWTNSFCGHPRDGEPIGEAVRRRGRDELGVDVTALEVVLPHFRYRAVDAGGVVENEVCPVVFGFAEGRPTPNPDEVLEARWVRIEDLEALVVLAPWMLSPWLVAQMDELWAAGMLTSRARAAG